MNRILRWIVSFVAVAVVAGCASVDPKPFERFHESASTFQSSSDEALQSVYELAVRGFRTPSSFGETVTFDRLLLTWDLRGDPTVPTQEQKPLHSMLRDMRRTSALVAGTFTEYSQLLALLAGGSEADAQRIVELAKTANSELRAARNAAGLELEDEGFALVATIGAEAMRLKIEKQRRDYLRETMDAAHGPIKELANFMVTTMDLVAGDVKATYLPWADAQRRAHSKEQSPAGKRNILVALLDRNDQTILLLESIRTLRDGFAKVPEAHAQLRARLDEPESLLTAGRRLYDDARRLQRLHKELAEAIDE